MIQMFQQYTGTPKCLNFRGGGERNSPNMQPQHYRNREPGTGCGCFTYGNKCWGRQLKLNHGDSMSSVKTASSCQRKCRSYYLCNGFLFDYKTKTCHIYYRYTGELECFAHTLTHSDQPRYVSGPHSCRGCMTKRSKTCPCLELKNACPTTRPARCGASTPAESFCDATNLPTTGSGACVLKGTFKRNCKIGHTKYLILYRGPAAPAGTPATLPTSNLSSYVKHAGWPSSHWTTLGPATTPCNRDEYAVTQLDPGDGYYYDPLPSGKGWCRPISSGGNVEKVRAEHKTGKWHWHHSGATYLPPPTRAPTRAPSKAPTRHHHRRHYHQRHGKGYGRFSHRPHRPHYHRRHYRYGKWIGTKEVLP